MQIYLIIYLFSIYIYIYAEPPALKSKPIRRINYTEPCSRTVHLKTCVFTCARQLSATLASGCAARMLRRMPTHHAMSHSPSPVHAPLQCTRLNGCSA